MSSPLGTRMSTLLAGPDLPIVVKIRTPQEEGKGADWHLLDMKWMEERSLAAMPVSSPPNREYVLSVCPVRK